MKNFKTSLALGILTASLLVTTSYAVSDNVTKIIKETQPIKIDIQEFDKKLTIKLVTKDGKETVISDSFNQTPKTYNNRTLIGLRDMSENLGWNVDWDQTNKVATITKDGKVLEFPTHRNFMFLDGEKVELEVPSATKDDRLYLPLRFIGETLGYEVVYDHANRTATLVEPGAKVAKTKDQLIEYTEAEVEEARKYGYLGTFDEYEIVEKTALQEDSYEEIQRMVKYANSHLDENGWYNGDPLDIWKAGKAFGQMKVDKYGYAINYPVFNDKIANKEYNGKNLIPNVTFKTTFGIESIENHVYNKNSVRPYGKIEGDTSLITDRVVDNALEVNPAKYNMVLDFVPGVYPDGDISYSVLPNKMEAKIVSVQDENGKWYPINKDRVTPEIADEMADKILVKVMFKSNSTTDTYIVRVPAKKSNAIR